MVRKTTASMNDKNKNHHATLSKTGENQFEIFSPKSINKLIDGFEENSKVQV